MSAQREVEKQKSEHKTSSDNADAPQEGKEWGGGWTEPEIAAQNEQNTYLSTAERGKIIGAMRENLSQSLRTSRSKNYR